MHKKIASLLLISLVTLSIIYGCCNIILPSYATRSIEAEPSPTTLTETPHQTAKLSCPKRNLDVLGDPIDIPRPK